MAGNDEHIRNTTGTEGNSRSNKCVAFVLIPIVLSLILFLVGFVTPGWEGLKLTKTSYGGFGLWYDYLCQEGSGCETKEFAHGLSSETKDETERFILKYRVMASLALVFQIIATIFAVMAIIPKTNLKQYMFTFLSICGICLFFSATFSLVTSGMYGHKNIKDSKKYPEIKLRLGESLYKFPYSTVLFGIGGIISALTLFFIVGTFCYKRISVNRTRGNPMQMS